MTDRRRISVLLPEELITRLDDAAERRAVSRHLIVAAGVRTFLDHLDDDQDQQPIRMVVPPARPSRRRWWQPR